MRWSWFVVVGALAGLPGEWAKAEAAKAAPSCVRAVVGERGFADVPTAKALAAPARLRIDPRRKLGDRWGAPATAGRLRILPAAQRPADRLPFAGVAMPAAWAHERARSLYRALGGETPPREEGSSGSAPRFRDFTPAAPLDGARRAAALAAYRPLLAAAETLRQRNVPLLESEKRALERELAELAAARFFAEGIHFRAERLDDDELRLTLLRSGTHALNVWARNQPVGRSAVTVAFAPGLAGPLAIGSYCPRPNLIALGPPEILALNPRSHANAHERRHGFNSNTEGRELGASSSENGTLPAFGPNTYRFYESHDEMDTYLDDLLRALDQARQALWKTTIDYAVLNTALAEIEISIRLGGEMGLRNVTIARQNRLMLDEGGAVPEYEYALEQWWAKVKVIGRHSTYVSAFPLPGSRGADDPENVAILRTRIDWLDKLGFNHAVQTMLAQHVYERFYAIESRHELLAMIEALYGTIRHWNPDNYRPIFLNQAIARFHRLLDFHFERLRLGPEEGMAVPPDRPMTFGRS